MGLSNAMTYSEDNIASANSLDGVLEAATRDSAALTDRLRAQCTL